MTNIMEISEHCRLCLVKDEVNIPIFEDEGDIRQVLLKITACLPVKIAKNDSLPKRICDGCLYKLESCYQFWNTSVNSEKQLLQWLSETLNGDAEANLHALKQEPADNLQNESQVFLQQQLAFQDTENYGEHFEETNYKPKKTPTKKERDREKRERERERKREEAEEEAEAPAPKRKRRAATKKPAIEIDDDDDDEEYVPSSAAITKTEDDSEDGNDDPGDDYGGDENASDDNQDEDTEPGPSGTTKSSSDAPFTEEICRDDSETVANTNYQCEVCLLLFPEKSDFLNHYMAQYGQTFTCCRCSESFKNSTDLIQHYEVHKLENLNEQYSDQTATEIEETVELNYDPSEAVISNTKGINADETLEVHYANQDGTLINVDSGIVETQQVNETLTSTSDLLYILDEGQNITLSTQKTVTEDAIEKPVNNYTIIVDHGYMLPNSFEESTPKRKYKKKGNMFFLRTEAGASESSQDCDSILVQMEPSSSKDNLVYAMPKPRQSIILPRKRHELPDFTASEYQVIQPTEEIDIVHYKCIRCEQLFISKFVFYRHIEKGKCYVNSCDVCTATFPRNSEFYSHYLTDHGDRAICNFCFRTFMYEKNVKEHMLRHLDQFRHRCEECNKGFYTVREYRNHYKNRHMGIRHKCDYCDRTFADEYYFKRHLAMHTITVPTRYSV